MLQLIRRYHFAAAHRLHQPDFDDATNKAVFMACNNENGHGHNYEFIVHLTGQLDNTTGMLINFVVLDELVQQHIIDVVDHKHLDKDVAWFQGTVSTAENMARLFFEVLAPLLPTNVQLVKVLVWENANNAAEYEPLPTEGGLR